MADARHPRHALGFRVLRTAVSLALRNLLFTVVVPSSGAVYVPWWILTRGHTSPKPVEWVAVALIATGAGLYLSCVWVFAVVGKGTPGPWDAPRHFVAVGPYRWVRNPIYLGALSVVLGEAWLFLSLQLLKYSAAMAILFHLFVIGYEEPTLYRRFGEAYSEYRRTVPRWIPRRPRDG
ncbi:MAG TPA: isoprenylcysteine carboxylmethyltransferase family protein [Anaeromyxobacter sp.]|nr:isoprenylcysteine carboxylmethyltransferase family protein [Anaeromyxobacter sp.]